MTDQTQANGDAPQGHSDTDLRLFSLQMAHHPTDEPSDVTGRAAAYFAFLKGGDAAA